MNTHAEKTQEKKKQSVANSVSQKQNGVKSTFQFVDNRPEAIIQRKLQEMANNSAQVKKMTQLRKMDDNNYVQKHPVQRKIIVDGEEYENFNAWLSTYWNLNKEEKNKYHEWLKDDNVREFKNNKEMLSSLRSDGLYSSMSFETRKQQERVSNPDKNDRILNFAEIMRMHNLRNRPGGKSWNLDFIQSPVRFSGQDEHNHPKKAGINSMFNSDCADPKVQDFVETQVESMVREPEDSIDVFHYDDEKPCSTACDHNLRQQAARLGIDIHVFLRQGAEGFQKGGFYKTYDKSQKKEKLKFRGFTRIDTIINQERIEISKLTGQLKTLQNNSLKIVRNQNIPQEKKTPIIKKKKDELNLKHEEIEKARQRLTELLAMKQKLKYQSQY